MSWPPRARLIKIAPVVILTVVGFAGVAFASNHQAVQAAFEATRTAETAFSLAGKLPELAAGGTLIGLGVGAVTASTAMYWYQNKQIEGRLK